MLLWSKGLKNKQLIINALDNASATATGRDGDCNIFYLSAI